jgi:ribonucleoside-diphosphate reductase alpha chain
LNDKVGVGDVIHTGVTPFYRLWQAAVESTSQGGVRKGSATLNVLFWHPEILSILSLKNNKGVEENSARNIDYVVLLNKTMYKRFQQKKNITLFSPKDVPDLYNAYFGCPDKFEELYEKYERSRVPKTVISAEELFTKLLQERAETGRIYILNVDHANTHTPIYEPIRMTNLCVEILQATEPVKLSGEGLIALCTLSAVNMAKVLDPKSKKMEKIMSLVVYALDALLDYQDYMEPAARNHTMKYRPLGIGVTNLAYFLVKHKSGYNEPNLQIIDEWFEAMTFYGIKASNELAKRFGACTKTRYHEGIVPFDLAKQKAKDLVNRESELDWASLVEALIEWGIRNATLFAIMPSETSSLISNSTNGIDQIRSLVTFKASNDGPIPQAVPEIEKHGKNYELLWDNRSMKGMIQIAATIQKWFDQSMSLNLSYNPKHYPENKIPLSVFAIDVLTAYQLGIKTLYYHNTRDGSGEIELKDDSCDSCKI